MNGNLRSPQKTSSSLCIIFDLDGTLIDSESLCNKAFLDLLPSIDESDRTFMDRYRGQKLAEIIDDLQNRYDMRLPDDFEELYRKRVSELFASNLHAMPGAHRMLKAIDYRRCIASSGPIDKIRQALEVCSLAQFFGDDLFSSYEIASWKPDPGLFLYAASSMGFKPERCIVVEDSDVGIAAARAAGMRAFRFLHGHADKGSDGVATFASMDELPRLLEKIAVDEP